MGLILGWSAAGAGFLTSKNVYYREYEVEQDNDFVKFGETTTTITTEWNGLSIVAVNQALAESVQPGENDASYSYSARLQNRIIRSYTLQRVYEKKVTEQI